VVLALTEAGVFDMFLNMSVARTFSILNCGHISIYDDNNTRPRIPAKSRSKHIEMLASFFSFCVSSMVFMATSRDFK